jgi:ribose transport system permease protein
MNFLLPFRILYHQTGQVLNRVSQLPGSRLLGTLAMLLLIYGSLLAVNPRAGSLSNHQNLGLRLGVEGVLVLGVGVVIITGGIDLSIGAVVGFSAVLFARFLEEGIEPVWSAILVLGITPLIGLKHGLLITKLKLQPFLVTLCSLFIYRGAAQVATWTQRGMSQNVGLGNVPFDMSMFKFLIGGMLFGVPWALILLLVLACVAAVFLHGSIYGRYLYAIGSNEQAARYAGVPTDRYKIMAYIWSSLMAGLGGILYMLEYNTANPANAGNWFELFAITGAVLGGCSLRGGEGSIAGMVMGAAILPLLKMLCYFANLSSDVHPAVIGFSLLIGTTIDELMKRRSAKTG